MSDETRGVKRQGLLGNLTGRFAVLFWFLVVVIAMPVLLTDGPIIRRWMGGALFVLMLSGLNAIAERRRHLLVGVLLAAPAVGLTVIGLAGQNFTLYVASQYLYLAFFVYLAVHILRWTMRQHEVTSETIYGAVNVYLLMALIWGVAYYAIALAYPGSFHFPEAVELGTVQTARVEALEAGVELPPIPEWTEVANSAQGTMMYYSFVTITTLGYGDIFPASDATRILAMLEATLGQLFLVILVARLVGLYTAQDSERRRKATPP